jgi:hypothetical protein
MVGLGAAGLLLGAVPSRAADQLLFCNQPERLTARGAYADAQLEAGREYRIFFHYRNASGNTAPLVVAFEGTPGKPLTVLARKGIADPHARPPIAGRQATARFLNRSERSYRGSGRVRFPMTLRPGQVASGVLSARLPEQGARLRIYFGNNHRVVTGARVVAVEAPRREYQVSLTAKASRQFYRIGIPDPELRKQIDGTYGFVYRFKLTAPPGRKVRIAFSPRGGQSGMVALVGGVLRQSPIVAHSLWSTVTDTFIGKDGLIVTTLPFGGVFYPVELVFRLL